MKPIQFLARARVELEAAAERYEVERPGRGNRFTDAVERAIQLIADFSEAGPPYRRLESVGVRRVRLSGFPFVIVYRITRDAIRIDAVAHARRRPGYWRRR